MTSAKSEDATSIIDQSLTDDLQEEEEITDSDGDLSDSSESIGLTTSESVVLTTSENSDRFDYKLKVEQPKTKMTNGQTYTVYCITFETQNTVFRLPKSQTWRRFSEFVWLRKELKKIDSFTKPPPLPSKKRFWNLQDSNFVEVRREKVAQWLHDVLKIPLYHSSMALHLVLQTEMPLESIQDYLDGKLAESRMEEIWSNQGKLFNYQPHNLLHNSFRQHPIEIVCSMEVPRSELPQELTTQEQH